MRIRPTGMGADQRDTLIEIVSATPWLMRALRAVRSVAPPGACVGAGAVRATVWDLIHGYAEVTAVADVDVAYFDPGDLSRESEARYSRLLSGLEAGFVWDVVNQAAVHRWYEATFGQAVPALRSLEEGVGSWPETATCVAVRLDADERVQVIAPLGLADLFACVIRRNPARVSVSAFRERALAKRYIERWPRVRIVWE